MKKNSFLILLLAASLAACNSSTKKQETTDTNQQVQTADTAAKSPTDTTAASKMVTKDTSLTALVPADQLITPGKSIGHIAIGDDVQAATKLLGRPDSSDAAMGSSLMVWFAKHDVNGYRTSIFSHRNAGGADEAISRVQKILVTSPWFKTASHAGVTSPIDSIKHNYTVKPTSTYKLKGDKVQVYTDLDKGISFEINTATNKCVGVVVHKAYDTASAYLSMH
ncbi:hypothetical protein SAMN05216464_109203 [Mucilaginibacter pineti]|uniref:Lipoprotein n=1 Tax=Mucilaginibacter pineti TaxID=1391627 RepID=A0A1G7FTE7_9SPHI|nr:hypothetical protein [Mucilaginibacter pineti]SDE79052.1 hypothetical protein SAMN05216464_109203 [Mucilaginibacter pineti]